MPYINQSLRTKLDNKMKDLLSDSGNLSCGELNYIISNLLNEHLEQKKIDNTFNYSACNSIVGVLECAKLEFYNKLVTPYENIKIAENGELYKEQNSNLLILQSEYKKLNDQINACKLIYSLQDCDSFEDLFRNDLHLLEDKLHAITIALNNLN
jgi:hypothetical protein